MSSSSSGRKMDGGHKPDYPRELWLRELLKVEFLILGGERGIRKPQEYCSLELPMVFLGQEGFTSGNAAGWASPGKLEQGEEPHLSKISEIQFQPYLSFIPAQKD